MIKTEIGPVTAYADAVKAGYTGTREEFARDQANFAQNASNVANMKQAVEQTVEEFHTAAEQAKQDVSDEGDRQVQRIADAAPDLELDRKQIEENKKAIEGKYAKPETGIPASDLAEGAIPDVSKKLTQPETAQVGQIFKVKSVNEDGTLVLESVDMPSGGVGDVQINGTSIVGEDGVAVVPIMSVNTLGVARVGNGVEVINGVLYTSQATNDNITKRINYTPITPANADYTVKIAMTDGKGEAWTDAEKTGSWSRQAIIKTAMDEVAVAGASYLLGEQTEVTVVLPDDALVGQEITVAFYNGETPATLSIMGNTLDFDFTPAANTRSEISCLWDGVYWSIIGMSQDVPAKEVVASE